jgi:Domain of unknown function (DUF4252)
MKKIITLALFLGLATGLCAQSRAVRNFMDAAPHHRENALRLNLGSFVISLARGMVDEPEARNVLRRVSHISLLAFDDHNPISKDEATRFMQELSKEKFEDLGYFRSKEGELVRLMVKENGDFISDLVLLIEGEGNFLMLNLEGRLRYSEINDLHMEFDGSSTLREVPEDRSELKKSN